MLDPFVAFSSIPTPPDPESKTKKLKMKLQIEFGSEYKSILVNLNLHDK